MNYEEPGNRRRQRASYYRKMAALIPFPFLASVAVMAIDQSADPDSIRKSNSSRGIVAMPMPVSEKPYGRINCPL